VKGSPKQAWGVAPHTGDGVVRSRLYAGKPGVSATTRPSATSQVRMGSDNVSGAENQQERPTASAVRILRDHTPAPSSDPGERMRWSGPHGDVGRLAETTSPPIEESCPRGFTSNRSSEIPCRVSSPLPRVEATPRANPAHNGEAHTASRRRVMPWEALCPTPDMAP